MSRLQKELAGQYGEYWMNEAKTKIEKAKAEFNKEMTVDKNGVVRNCIGRIIMADMVEILTLAGCEFNAEATNEARKEENSALIAEYKRNQKPATQEEIYEMRSAFGKGTKVVDVFTGRTTQL